LFRTVLLAGDGLVEERPVGPDEVKRLGECPVVAILRIGNATLEVAAGQADLAKLPGPFHDAGTTVQITTV
jgi:hypothetical protein